MSMFVYVIRQHQLSPIQTFRFIVLFSCLTLAILCLAPSEAIFALGSYTPDSLTTHRSHELASQAKGVKALWFEHSGCTTQLGSMQLCHTNELAPRRHPHLVDQQEMGILRPVSSEQR